MKTNETCHNVEFTCLNLKLWFVANIMTGFFGGIYMIDLRSDTVTKPTTAMLEAMMYAEVGDDILREDVSIQELEQLAAAITGKEAGLFTVSGTMSNQIAVMAFTQRGDEIIAGAESHIYNLEVAGLAALSQVQVKPIFCPLGRMSLDKVEEAIRPYGVQSPRTSLICLENTYNLNRGYAVSAQEIENIALLAHQRQIPVYLDGARIFNAAEKLQTEIKNLCQPVDAMQFCLTKGLAAPFGSILAGSCDFIEKARWMKQRIGGGFRQAGYMAAAGIIALKTMRKQIAEDNQKAQYLAGSLQKFNAEIVLWEECMTNIVTLDLTSMDICEEKFLSGLLEHDIKVKSLGQNQYRMICHKDISWHDLHIISSVIEGILKNKRINS